MFSRGASDFAITRASTSDRTSSIVNDGALYFIPEHEPSANVCCMPMMLCKCSLRHVGDAVQDHYLTDAPLWPDWGSEFAGWEFRDAYTSILRRDSHLPEIIREQRASSREFWNDRATLGALVVGRRGGKHPARAADWTKAWPAWSALRIPKFMVT